MTTTTNTTIPDAFVPADDEIAALAAAAKGNKTTGGFTGPAWVPNLSAAAAPELKDEARLAKVAKAGPGSFTARAVSGKLVAAHAWGRRVYFLDVKGKGGETVRVKLPESKLLYRGLNLCELGAVVAVTFDGAGKPATPGQKAPWLYTVASVDRKELSEPRADAFMCESMDERTERIARERAKRDAANEPGGDDDTPF